MGEMMVLAQFVIGGALAVIALTFVMVALKLWPVLERMEKEARSGGAK